MLVHGATVEEVEAVIAGAIRPGIDLTVRGCSPAAPSGGGRAAAAGVRRRSGCWTPPRKLPPALR
jgi:hypothetical protein